jgi:rRNA processing protein Gar1
VNFNIAKAVALHSVGKCRNIIGRVSRSYSRNRRGGHADRIERSINARLQLPAEQWKPTAKKSQKKKAKPGEPGTEKIETEPAASSSSG